MGARNFGHYFQTLVPAGATVTAYIIWKTINGVKATIGTRKLNSWLSAGWFVLFAALAWWLGSVVIQYSPNANQLASINRIIGGQYEIGGMEQYIIDTTTPEDRVLVWHVHTGVNFITNRKAASRVLFPMNLFIGNSKMHEFVAQMKTARRELIVFQKASSIGMPFVDENIDEWCKSSCMPEVDAGLKQPVVYDSLKRFQAPPLTPDEAARAGFEVVRASRAGQVSFHFAATGDCMNNRPPWAASRPWDVEEHASW